MRLLSKLLAVVVMVGSTALWAAGGVLPGSGTEGDPYRIEDLADFDEFANPANAATYWASGVHTKLTCDIDLSGRTYTTAVIALDAVSSSYSFDGVPFMGEFNGTGHRILNLAIDTEGIDKDFLGLFGMVGTDAVVTNLGLEDVSVIGSGNWDNGDFTGDIGALVGNNSGVIRNCWVSGSVTVGISSEDVGGLCGWNQSTGSIIGCYVTGSVFGGSNSGGLGGLCGGNDGSITNCWSRSSVTGRNSLGGLCGNHDIGTITNCYSTGSVNGTAEHLGGLCGEFNGGIISNCYFLDSAGPDNGHGTPLANTLMKQQGSFAGWDFTDETINGTDDIWRMCQDGIGYPRLSCEFSQYGDFLCPDGVYFEDLYVVANEWLEEGALRSDLNYDGVTDFSDLAIFCERWLYEDKISNHVFSLEISTEWDYGSPDDGYMSHDFELDVSTDDTVGSVEFVTPAGNTFSIPAVGQQCNGEACTFFEPDGEGKIEWTYYGRFSSESSLDSYGDGHYTIVVHYLDGTEDQTMVWYGIPGTDNPIPQPKIQPIMISPVHNGSVSSPVTFTWQPCLDANATGIDIGGENETNGDEVWVSLPVDSVRWENVVMSAGDWDLGLSFENLFFVPDNGDGIPIECYKCSTTDYWFTVTPD